MDVSNATGLEENPRCVYPRPKQLPDDRQPPFPALAAVEAYFHTCAFYSVIE
jgi:hypothetical protein